MFPWRMMIEVAAIEATTRIDEVLETLRGMQERMNALEGGMRRARAHEESDSEDDKGGAEMDRQAGDNADGDMDEGERRLIRDISNIGKGTRVKLPSFSRSLEPGELIY